MISDVYDILWTRPSLYAIAGMSLTQARTCSNQQLNRAALLTVEELIVKIAYILVQEVPTPLILSAIGIIRVGMEESLLIEPVYRYL
jgi:hypothetical protein